ncbi:MAG: tetratricopeptide repeat protein [Thermodesulfovibrionales bacterium]
MSRIDRWFRNPVVAVTLLFTACLAVYGNTLNHPFVFDDNLNIVDNAKIRDISRFWPPAGNRWLGGLSFALNYEAGGLDVTGYHLVNIAVHCLNTLLVYALVRLVFRTPLFASWSRNPGNSAAAPALSFFCAAIFAVHPVQTQAVTYIVQRFTSLAALFYILSVVLYMAARLKMSGEGWKGPAIALYSLGLLSAVLAMKTKEIAFTLPFAVCLAEFSFFRTEGNSRSAAIKERFLLIAPFLLTLVIIPSGMLSFGKQPGAAVMSLSKTLNASADLSRHDYFLTQSRVVATYLRLLLLPINQSFDYLYPVTTSVTEPSFLMTAALHLMLLAGALCLLTRADAESPLPGLIGFGIVWFYLALSVESSVIPISDAIFEHRVYLPAAGLLTSCCAGCLQLLRAVDRQPGIARGLVIGACCLIPLLGIAAYERNGVWAEELALWQDVVSKNPSHARGHNMIGIIHKKRGELDSAIEAFRAAIRVQPDYAEAHVNLGSTYIVQGRLDDAMPELLTALGFHSMDRIDTAALFINIAYYHILRGAPEKALSYLMDARQMTPEDASVYYFLGMAYRAMGDGEQAAKHREKAHQLNPDKY